MARYMEQHLADMPLDREISLLERNMLQFSNWSCLEAFEELTRCSQGRRFIFGENDLICLGAAYAAPRDIICVLLGCSTPVILRECGDYYTYVDDVYFDGYMHGRAIDELNDGTRQLQTFELG